MQILSFLLQRPSRVLWRQSLLVIGTALALWALWIPYFLKQVAILREIDGALRGAAGIGSTTEPTTLRAVQHLLGVMSNGQIVLYAALLVLGGVFLWRKRAYWLLLLWGLGAPALALLTNFFLSVYTPRYYAYASIGLALAVGAALATSVKILSWPGRGLALAAFAVIGLLTLPDYVPRHVPYRDLFRQVTARPGDIVVFERAYEDDNFLEWQIRQYLSPDLQPATNLDEALNTRRVWFVTGDWFNDDVRTTFSTIEQSHPLQNVIGKCDREWCFLMQLLEAPPFTAPVMFGDEMAFYGADVDDITEGVVQTRLWWRVIQTPQVDYSISLQLLDINGALVAQTDAPINHYGNELLHTSHLQPERIYVDFRRLLLPPEMPMGDYDLALVVYQSWDGHRLTLPEGSDYLPLDTIRIGGNVLSSE